MKWMFGKTAMWIMATLAVATIPYAATQDAQLPEGDGKKILQTACTACHGLEMVTGLRLDKAGWEGIVSEMVSTGAQVDQKDYPVLVDYLVKNFGPAGAKPAGQSLTTLRPRRFSMRRAPRAMTWISYPTSTSAKTNGRTS